MSDFPFKIQEQQTPTGIVIQVGEKKWCNPKNYKKYALEFYHFKVRPSDIWLLGFLRCGTTVTQDLLWLLCNNLDFKTAEEVLVRDRFPSLEHIALMENNEKVINSWIDMKQTQKQRFIKTHLPFELLPQDLLETGAKVVYLLRDPKDTIISYFHIANKLSTRPPITFVEFWEKFRNDLMMFTPYGEHVKEAWSKRNHKNFLLVFYDDIIHHQEETIKKIANFIEKPVSDLQAEQIEKFLSHRNFLKDTECIKQPTLDFKPKSEDNWKKYFVGDLENQLDEWMKDNFSGTNIVFTS